MEGTGRSRRVFKMLLSSFILVCLCVISSYGERRDYYTGEPLTEEQFKYYSSKNLIENCTIDVKPCNANEGRRVDGSCNNLDNPARGTFLSPLYRVLPAKFGEGNGARKAKSGKDLPPERFVRSTLIKVGKSSHSTFNHNVPGYAIFLFNDIGSLHDTENLLVYKTDCCEEGHMNDEGCVPHILPEDDYVHRYSGIRCMNSTAPLTHQYYGCSQDPTPSPVARATEVMDLSNIYNTYNKGDEAVRSFQGGKLIVEQEDGKDFPPNGPTAFCPNNIKERNETRCFENHFNSLLPISLYTIWFVRFHNFVATKLAEVNPCWDDDTLFKAARNINIASALQMYLYEWMVAVQGYDNALKNGIIGKDDGFRKTYNSSRFPQTTVEFSFALRWFHLLQEGNAKLYDRHGTYLRDYPIFNMTFKAGYLAQDNHMEHFTQSTIREPCREYDYSVDFDTANNGLPGVQKSFDILAGDLKKFRLVGIGPYVDYVKYYTGIEIKNFDDLKVLMSKENIMLLKRVYECVEDIDFIAGLWLENTMEGGYVPYTFAATMNDHVLRHIAGDRFWYESPDSPTAFTLEQLKSIRNVTLASFLCSIGDGIYEIQKKAFLIPSPENPIVSCSEIPKLDFSAWADSTCSGA